MAATVSAIPLAAALLPEEDGTEYKLHQEDYFEILKVGRNEACPCHSGLKFKRCCLNKSAAAMPAQP